jgi:enoyl-CoA hydratase/carnithine racemase
MLIIFRCATNYIKYWGLLKMTLKQRWSFFMVLVSELSAPVLICAPSPVIARQVRWERDVWGLFLSLPQPIIAALHGFVLGSGIEMALCCDIRVASDDAQFGLPEMSLGLIPAAGATQTLPRIIGRAASLDMLIANRWLKAQEAFDLGLVNQVMPRDQLMFAVNGMARKLADYDQRTLRTIKEAVLRGCDLSLDEGLELERRLAVRLFSESVM